MADRELVYAWKVGSAFEGRRTEAAVVARELERIGAADGSLNDMSISPQAVVDAARNRGSVLHPFFQWDDSIAAEAHRRQQARQLVGALVVTGTGPKGPVMVRAFVTVQAQGDEDTRGYQPTVQALSDESRRALVLQEALEGLNRWRREYAALSEFSQIFAAIDQTTRQIGGKRRRRA